MSPYLPFMSMEYYCTLLNTRTIESEFNWHAKCHYLKLTHLVFTDDLMFFSVSILMDTFKEFEACSGLNVNNNKSTLLTSGLRGIELVVVQDQVSLDYPYQ